MCIRRDNNPPVKRQTLIASLHKQTSPGYHQEPDWNHGKQMPPCWQACSEHYMPITTDFITYGGMWNWNDHPCKFVLTLKMFLTLCCWWDCLLWPAIQDAVLVQGTFLLCQWSKQLVIDYIRAIHWSNIVSEFGTFSCTQFYVVIFSVKF